MSALGTITASCVHCLWRTDVEGDALSEARDLHELMHPGGTVLVGDDTEPSPIERIRAIPDRPTEEENAMSACEKDGCEKPAVEVVKGGKWKRAWCEEHVAEYRDARRRGGRAGGGHQRRTSGSSPSSEGAKREAVPPPAADPEPGPNPERPEASGNDPEETLVELARAVEELSTRRRAMLAELDVLEEELRQVVAALRAALTAHELKDAA